jgi:hypothetical protein
MEISHEWGESGTADRESIIALGVNVDSSRNGFVVDRDNSRIQKFDTNRDFISKFVIEMYY